MALSCEKHTAFLYDRGGVRQLAQLGDLLRVKWERRRDEPSNATVWIGTPGLECQKALGLAETNRVELVVFRGGERVWEGPISRISYMGSSVEIEARDVMLYVVRTIMRSEYDNRNPNTSTVLHRIRRIINSELSRKEALDPPINVIPHIQYLEVQGTVTHPSSYSLTAPVKTAIRAASTVQQLTAAVEGMQAEYGLSLDFGLPPGNSFPGLSWNTARIQDWQLRQYMALTVDALAKYPPDYIKAAQVEGIYFVKDIDMGRGFNVGGAATSNRLYLDITDYAQQKDMVFGSEHIIHHELNHLEYFTFGAANIQARWQALNPPGFQYNEQTWANVDYEGMHPRGFIRDYGRVSFVEDLADYAGAVLSTSMQAYLSAISDEDPIVRGKVALFKEWMQSNGGGLLGGKEYFDAIVGGSAVVSSASGASDARTAARTLPYEMTLFEHIDNYAARGGIDYTVIGRSILFFDTHHRIGQTPMVTKDDFIGDPIITQYGMELATYVAMTDGKGNFGAAGGVDEYYGEWEVLHQAYDEDAQGTDPEDAPSVAELRSQAQRAHKQGSRPPLVVRIPDNTRLNPNGVLTISDLVPGVWIPLSATLPGRTVSQMQKLDNMTVEETADTGEQIKITLSAAYAQTFVEEE